MKGPPSFRAKLLLALMATVVTVVAATLIATRRGVAATYERFFRERFLTAVDAATRLQEARLAAVRARCRELASSVRLMAAIEENDPEILYRIALDELRDVLRPPGGGRAATFFRLIDAEGRIVPPTDERAGKIADAGALAAVLAPAPGSGQEVGYVGDASGGSPRLLELVRTRIVDPVEGATRGALLIGFPVEDESEIVGDPSLQGGLWVGGRLYSHSIPAASLPVVAARLQAAQTGEDDAILDVGGVPHRLFVRPLGNAHPRVLRVVLYSTAEAQAELDRLRRQVLAVGAFALLAALATSLFLSRGLSVPVRDLVRGTAEIQSGNFDVRVPVRSADELGRLAASFNEMAAGLRVLNVVADRAVAKQLVEGGIELGGELRDVSILFCDIRGFTALTEGMPPAEVIAMLNEHMSALTAVVHANHGVVDKFVGDSLMALFGAPRSGGDDATAAVHAAVGVLEARAALNRTSRHVIEIGVGVASGTVVAGCLGSSERSNYTVIGAQVNLAARLCGSAPRGEVWIDETTARRVGAAFDLEALPPLELKGFREPVRAFRVRRREARTA